MDEEYKLDIKYNVEIKNPNDLLLFEINKHVDNLFMVITSEQKLNLTDKGIKQLNLYKESLKNYDSINNEKSYILADHLVKKIDYILEVMNNPISSA